MKQVWTIALFVFCLLSAQRAKSQDIHFSQFFASPLYLNPANAGRFDATYRLAGIQRRQWQSITTNPYQTLGGSVDMNDPLSIKSSGAGLRISNDVAGAGSLRTFQLDLFLAKHFLIGTSKEYTLSVGGGMGYRRTSVDVNAFSFDNQFNGVRHDPSLPNGEGLSTPQITNLPVAGGFYLERKTSERNYYGLGVSLFNIGGMDLAFSSAYEARASQRLNVHSTSSFKIADQFDLLPAFRLMFQQPHAEMVAGTALKYHIEENNETPMAFQLGIWARWRDAAYISAGLDYDNLFVGLAYDVNYSSLLPATNYRGGWEVSLIYTIETVREKIKRIRQCPDFI